MKDTKPYNSKEAQKASKWYRNLVSVDRARINKEFLTGIARSRRYLEKGEDCSHCHRDKALELLIKKHNVDNPQELLEKFLIAKKNSIAFEFLA